MNNQEKVWNSDFGSDYTERNIYCPCNLNKMYKEQYGITREEMNDIFLKGLDKNIRILEVGCNVGNQLKLLQKMGFTNLYGIEIQKKAVEKSKEFTTNINIIYGKSDDIPFKDNYFDLVFTSGVLIHIAPENIKKTMKEIYRCSKTYIWGFEYFDNSYREIKYRNENKLLWKSDFVDLYKKHIFPYIIEIKIKTKYKHLEDENIDEMFLIKK